MTNAHRETGLTCAWAPKPLDSLQAHCNHERRRIKIMARPLSWLQVGWRVFATMVVASLLAHGYVAPALAQVKLGAPEKEVYKYEPIPRQGQFHYSPMATFNPDPADQKSDGQYFGLHMTDVWPALHLQGEDGNLYHYAMWVSHDPQTGKLSAGQWGGIGVVTTAGVGPHPEARTWQGPVTQNMTADGRLQYILGDGEQTVSYDKDSATWTSRDGQINVTGKLVAPGIGFLIPWREPSGKTDSMYYTGQFYHVAGTFYGVKVSGGMTMDLQYGTKPYLDMWWVKNRQGNWTLFYTAFDDGSYDFGMFACGKYGARGAVATNSRSEELVNTTQMKLELAKDAKGQLTSAVYSFDNGQKWEFVPSTSSRFPLPNGGKPPPGFTVKKDMKDVRQGVWIRVGEKRKPVNAWGFFINTGENGCEPSPGMR